jgi:hypothetical protein
MAIFFGSLHVPLLENSCWKLSDALTTVLDGRSLMHLLGCDFVLQLQGWSRRTEQIRTRRRKVLRARDFCTLVVSCAGKQTLQFSALSNISLSFSPFLYDTVSNSHSNSTTLRHTHTHTLTQYLILPLSFSLTHTIIHSLTNLLTLSHKHSPLSLINTNTYTQTHSLTMIHSLTHTHSHAHTLSLSSTLMCWSSRRSSAPSSPQRRYPRQRSSVRSLRKCRQNGLTIKGKVGEKLTKGYFSFNLLDVTETRNFSVCYVIPSHRQTLVNTSCLRLLQEPTRVLLFRSPDLSDSGSSSFSKKYVWVEVEPKSSPGV